MKKILLQIVFILAVISVLCANVAFAETPTSEAAKTNKKVIAQVVLQPDLKPDYAVSLTAPSGATQEQKRTFMANAILQLLAGGLIYLAGPVAVLIIAIGGVRYIIARGDQGQIDEAKKNITYAIIGLIVIIVSYAIVTNIIRIISGLGVVGK